MRKCVIIIYLLFLKMLHCNGQCSKCEITNKKYLTYIDYVRLKMFQIQCRTLAFRKKFKILFFRINLYQKVIKRIPPILCELSHIFIIYIYIFKFKNLK